MNFYKFVLAILLIVVGLVEFLFRFVALLVFVCSVFGLLAIIFEDGVSVKQILTPYCWDILEGAI